MVEEYFSASCDCATQISVTDEAYGVLRGNKVDK
jgi:hypothetical protein